jgi:hypothetical protein
MHANLAIQLSEHAFTVLSNEATAAGKSPADLAASIVETIYGGSRTAAPDAEAARARFEQCFGSVDMEQPIGVENDAIDADLSRAYDDSGRSS